MRQSGVNSRKLYVDKLVALKSLALSLSNTSCELLIDPNRFVLDLSLYLFAVLNNIFDSGKT